MSIFAGTKLFREPKCDHCGKIEPDCVCIDHPPRPASPDSQTAVVRLEKRKKGKFVTVISGLEAGHPAPHYKNLLTDIKNHCGAGGSIKNHNIEVQGDQVDAVIRFLKQRNFRIQVQSNR